MEKGDLVRLKYSPKPFSGRLGVISAKHHSELFSVKFDDGTILLFRIEELQRVKEANSVNTATAAKKLEKKLPVKTVIKEIDPDLKRSYEVYGKLELDD